MTVIELLLQVADAARSSDVGRCYDARHGIRAAPTLTVTDDEVAGLVAAHLEERIRDRTVVEVGGGVGLLGLHMAHVAKSVFVIEANPIWSFAHLAFFHERKPANLSFCFGAAAEFIGRIKADVAVVATHSDVANMMSIAGRFAPDAIDVYGELIAANPSAFDEWARHARSRT